MRLEELQTPALLIRLDRVRANLARMQELLGGRMERWRPHVKTAKIPEVLDRVLGAGVSRFKCATSREASVLLARAGQPVDLLVAMAHRGANLERVARLAEVHARSRMSLLTEDPVHARAVRALAPQIGLYVDLNPGYDRTGIPRDDLERVRATADACGDAFRGLHDYEGHVRARDPQARAAECQGIWAGLLEIAAELEGAGAPVAEIVTSGTPTFEPALAHQPFAAYDHQVSPGTVVYFDGISAGFGLQGFAPAAVVLTRVLSVPGAGRVTCDAGSKAVDAAAGDPCAAVEGRPELRAGHPSEEHLPLEVASGAAPLPGELLTLVPAHVCPTVNLADQAVLLDGERIVGVVPVAARGHEVAAV